MNLSLGKLPWHTQIGAFVALSAAAVAVFFFLYVKPFKEEMAQREQQLQGLRTDIGKGLAIAQQLPQFKAQVSELELRLEGLKAVLPEEREKDFPDLLQRIQMLAVQSNLTVQHFKPATAAVPKQLHAEWPIDLTLDGTYHNLGLFFDRVSKLSRIINVDGLEIRAKDRQDPLSTITASCTATTFLLREAAKTPPAAPAPGAAVKPGT